MVIVENLMKEEKVVDDNKVKYGVKVEDDNLEITYCSIYLITY